jgi:Uma2 family endonuclease
MTSQFTETALPTDQKIPPLDNGDHLTCPEFERRYAAMPELKKAELIEGVVYLASPLRFTPHAEPHSRIATWIGTYAAFTPETLAGIDPTLRLDLDNELQPDAVLIISEQAGGRAKRTQEGYLQGIPELVIEIAASSASIDLKTKKQVYQRHAIPEYIVWQVFENELVWFHLREGTYQVLDQDPDGIMRSQVFPGLWLDVAALLNNQMSQVLRILQQGIESQDHQDFADPLAT